MMTITRQEAYQLIRADGTELVTLMQRASALRDVGHGNIVTYSRKVFIPLTNLCRDKCAYCTFARAPNDPKARTLTPDEVLAIAHAGKAQGCKEALFSLGDKPELLHAKARRHLQRLGYESTTSYLHAMCERVYEETGLIPHANAGIMSYDELAALRPFNGSMGIMLESVSERLMEKGQAHFGCPDKHPAVRLQMMRHAGELKIPFTTGILIGIGETLEERVDSLFAIADLHARYGHIQEVIVQNFRRKLDIRFRNRDEPSVLDMIRTIAVARLILGAQMSIQAPPNLTPDAYGMYLLAGINDWGGVSPVTADHINPEAAWPMIAELDEVTRDAGFELRERMTVYPQYIVEKTNYIHPPLRERLLPLVDDTGLVKPELTPHLEIGD
ncbi:MAG: 7,8-didemethyl-8-hydroxy-5-deazariboflavin synthase CofG [Ardenticatenaceae bacterium]